MQKKKMDAKKVLQEGIPAVLELVRQVLRPAAPAFTSPPSTPTSPLASPMLSPSGPPFYAQVDPASVPLHAAALRCVRAWVEWGVPVPDLLTDGGTLLGMLQLIMDYINVLFITKFRSYIRWSRIVRSALVCSRCTRRTVYPSSPTHIWVSGFLFSALL